MSLYDRLCRYRTSRSDRTVIVVAAPLTLLFALCIAPLTEVGFDVSAIIYNAGSLYAVCVLGLYVRPAAEAIAEEIAAFIEGGTE